MLPVLAATITAGFVQLLLQDALRKRCRIIHPYLRERRVKGRFVRDFDDLAQYPDKFRENFRMDKPTFEKLLALLEPYLAHKRNTRPKDGISPKEKLVIVLEYLACGSLQRQMACIYRVSKQGVAVIIDQVCSALCSALENEISQLTPSKMVEVANKFNYKWQFPNCVGALDGKHVGIKCPPKAGSMFFNYKGYHSMILMAVADADYKFLYKDVGAYGSEGDAGVFASCTLGKRVLQGSLQFPTDTTIEKHFLPYIFIGDDAFPLHKHIMKPYAPRKLSLLEDEQCIFNYRLSRARRCVENLFGIMCSRFYSLARTMFCSPDKAQKIIAACCHLHNFLLAHSRESYCPPKYADYYNTAGMEEKYSGRIAFLLKFARNARTHNKCSARTHNKCFLYEAKS